MTDALYIAMLVELVDIQCHHLDAMRLQQFIDDVTDGRVYIAETGEPITWAKNLYI